MLFTEPLFFAFFGVVFGVYWSIESDWLRKRWLLLASYAFYGAWDWRFLGLILASSVIDFVVGLALERVDTERARKGWLLVSLVGNLGLLGFFKYFDFFVTSANPLFETLGFGGVRTLDIVLPVGISFYTFQTMSYSIDIYRRRMRAISDFGDFALFVGFFPQLVMGPILRAIGFIPQMSVTKHLRDVRFQAMITLFAIGFFKKAVVSDNIAPIVDALYADPSGHTASAVWIAVIFYAIQLYCDFSGYTDMAIAVAGLLGYHVPTNFAFPFFAGNISLFWRRWHISFSSWLRDYLYFPLGGSRASELRTDWNLMLTMLASGLWHGAGLNFIAWGGLNGLGLVVHRHYGRLRLPDAIGRLFAALGHPLTFLWFAFTLICFRSQTWHQAIDIGWSFLSLQSVGDRIIDPWLCLWLLPLGGLHWVASRVDLPAASERVSSWVYAPALGVAVGLVAAFVRIEYRPFIYFQF